MNPRFSALITVVQLLSHVWLFCDPIVCSPPGSSVHGISQPRLLEWGAICYSRGSSQPSLLHRQADSLHWATREGLIDHYELESTSEVKFAQSCLTLCDPMDSRVHGILQARILEWVAFPFFRGSSQPRDLTQVSHIAGGFFTSLATREAQEFWSG